MIRILCPHCHASLAIAELEQARCEGLLSLVCPECASVVVTETAAPEYHTLDAHFADRSLAHA